MADRQTMPVWMCPNLLSLDAPFIAVVWQDFLDRCYPANLQPAGRAVLWLTVWAIYLADRLLDVRHPAQPDESVRHSFYRRHRARLQLLLAAVLGFDLLVAGLWLRPAVVNAGVLVGSGVLIYLAVFGFRNSLNMVVKRPAAAVLFTSGVFLIASVRAVGRASGLEWPAAIFFGLCLANLCMLERWNSGGKADRGWLLFVLLFSLRGLTRGLPWFNAAMVSALGLGSLMLGGERISSNARGVLADVALLTPLLFR